MQLGANKVLPSIAASILAEQWAEEISESAGAENPWGNDDLIDVNADEDDWSAFETAAPMIVVPKPITPVGLGLGVIGNGNGGSSRDVHLTDPPSRTSTPISKPAPPKTTSRNSTEIGWDVTRQSPSPGPTTPSLSEMTKEEKAAEMARRKEERKQRIALLKEQKKNATRT